MRCFGVRHHGPGSARSLLAALVSWSPDVVLVELPADVAPALGLVADPGLVPPVALLGYVTDQPARALFLPFAAFSPEWVALRWAAQSGVPVRPVDLALAHVLAPRDDRQATLGDGPPVDPLAVLAEAAGEDDPERWWDDVVEHRGGDLAFDGLAEAMAAVRATVGPPAPDEARREATMRLGVRQARADGFARIAVVCGAWHVPALTEPLPPVAADRALLRGQPKAKVSVTWVPWTDRRLASASGYGAGVASPAWYAHTFLHPGPDGVARWFVDAARVLRARDHATSPDDVIAATRLAEATALLRGRPRPGLAEVLDAATATLTGGRPGPLALLHERLVVGEGLGHVPEHAPMVPVARDLAAQQRRLRLRPAAVDTTVELDLRTATGLGRSHLLHRLSALGVPWGTLAEGRGAAGTFRETWRLRWEPELAVRLVDASALGTTVEAAATARLVELATTASALADLAAVVEVALLADLPRAIGPAAERLAAQAAHDPDLAHLIDSVTPLARALRYGDVRATDASALRVVVDGVVTRVLAGLVASCGSLDPDASTAMAERLGALQAALVLLDHPARATAWPATLVALGARVGPGVLQGRAVRLLHDAGHWSGDEVGRALSQALSPGTPPAPGAGFVEGFLAGSGTVLLHDRALLQVIDEWLATLGADAFSAVVPLLRRTFGGFEVAERHQIGVLVAGRDGRPEPAPFGWDLDPDRAAAALATAARLLGVVP